MVMSNIMRTFALSIINKSFIFKEKWQQTKSGGSTSKNFRKKLKKVQESDLPDDIKEKYIDLILDKMNIVKKYFLE